MSVASTPTRFGGGAFPQTQWSVVLAARASDEPDRDNALNALCRAYWPAVYRFIRREGHSVEAAQDLTQAFFERLISKEFLQHLRHQEGRFRSFLLAFVRHFLADERDRAQAQKRGGGQAVLSLEAFQEEEQRPWEPSATETPERAYERRWVQTVLSRAVARLQAEYTAAGQTLLFDVLKDLQPGERGADSYAALAERLHTTPGALKTAVFRLRKRHQELIREEIAQTLHNPAEIDAEIRHFLEVLGT